MKSNFLFFLFFSQHLLFSQKSTPGFLLNQLNKTNDTTTIGFYTSVVQSEKSFEFLDLNTRVSFNSSYPRGFNDGPVWKGKGATFELHGGIEGKKGKLSYQLMPVVFFSQNADYDLAPRNEEIPNQFGYQFFFQTRDYLDWVQRYGEDSDLYFHPGQSEIKFQTGKFISSLSTQNYSFGPSMFNPILLSQQGGGFPHLRLGSEPFSLGKKLGEMEVNFITGILIESNYFDEINENDERYYNALFFGYSPGFLDNLRIGLGKVLYKQTRYFEVEDLFSTIYNSESETREGLNTGNDTFDQMASVFIDWSFPSIGFRAYAEFAKNDFTGRTRGTIVEPEHSRGYSVGFEKKTITKTKKEILLVYEHINLSRNQSYLYRATPSFYAHGVNTQGYTNNGQLLGAGIGPGGNSDHIFVRVDKKSDESFGFLIQRIENNRDYFVTTIQDKGKHDIEYSLGTGFSKKLNNIQVLAELTLSHNFNRYYNDDKTNLAVMIGTSIDLN
ncbi:MAG: hypothetical protein AAF600_22105 [Bacteroidota bacterium]